MSKMPKQNPLISYIEKNDKILFEIIRVLGQRHLFDKESNKGSYKGITFLHPGKVYIKKIANVMDDSPLTAVSMLRSLILLDYLPEPSSFKAKKDDIPNALKYKLPIKDVDEKTVFLKDDFTLELSSKFTPIEGENYAVYKLSGKGYLPIKGEQSSMKYNKNPRGDILAINTTKYKKMLAKFAETQYLKEPLVYQYILSKLYYAMLKEPKDEAYFRNLKCIYDGMCASSIATFYNILSPHSTSGQLVPDVAYEKICDSISKRWYREDIEKEHNDIKHKFIKVVRSKYPHDQEERKKNYFKQCQILKKVRNYVDCIKYIKKAYNEDDRRISKDLLTIICYLTAVESETDESYYEKCFLYMMRNIFNDHKSILDGSSDLVRNMTLYANLLKSDIFLYVPVLDTSELVGDFKVLDSIPGGRDKTMFSIIKSESLFKFEGEESVETIRETKQIKTDKPPTHLDETDSNKEDSVTTDKSQEIAQEASNTKVSAKLLMDEPPTI